MTSSSTGTARQASSRAGFTLIELLVVISLVVLLIALLLPALAKARVAARQVACLSQARGLGQAFVLYMADNRDYFPRYSWQWPTNQPTPEPGYYSWTEVLVRGRYTAGATFICPGRESGYADMPKWRNALAHPLGEDFWRWPDLSYNYILGWKGWKTGEDTDKGQSVKHVQLRAPARLILSSDVVRREALYPNLNVGYLWMERFSTTAAPFPTHQGACNMVFADAHCEVIGVRGGATLLGLTNLAAVLNHTAAWQPY
jgi:prepilin-type N-terminal cleavage/methylation domain-containing protein/prepilin-type processing-associated H-X9-DG protein